MNDHERRADKRHEAEAQAGEVEGEARVRLEKQRQDVGHA